MKRKKRTPNHEFQERLTMEEVTDHEKIKLADRALTLHSSHSVLLPLKWQFRGHLGAAVI